MKKIKKRIVGISLAIVLIVSALSGCARKANTNITVVSREDGSGTRGAFVELMGIQEGDIDNTTDAAEITNSTSVMLTTIAGNTSAIGYVSLGSLDDSVTAVTVDGVAATVDNIKNGQYKISRPFNIVTKGTLSPIAQDFVNYIMSAEGQAIIEDKGYISVASKASYTNSGMSGKVTVAGSTSVGPLMEILAEKYKAINPNVTIEIQQTGSSAGITSAIEGVCDIGMSSRDLKDSEKSSGLTSTAIAMDGIAVIVNNDNTIKALTSEQIKNIFTGNITSWTDLK